MTLKSNNIIHVRHGRTTILTVRVHIFPCGKFIRMASERPKDSTSDSNSLEAVSGATNTAINCASLEALRLVNTNFRFSGEGVVAAIKMSSKRAIMQNMCMHIMRICRHVLIAQQAHGQTVRTNMHTSPILCLLFACQVFLTSSSSAIPYPPRYFLAQTHVLYIIGTT